MSKNMKQQLLLIATLLFMQLPAVARDLTGQYEVSPTKRCSSKLLNSENLGNAYKWHCFTGNAYGYSPVLNLIQNGQKLCGTYSECGGYDCNKAYSGELVGLIKGNKVTIYYANGHHFGGEAEKLEFLVVSGGLAYGHKTLSTASLIIRSRQMKYPSSKKLCNPETLDKVMIDENYGLRVEGALKEDQSQFINLKQSKFAAEPPTKTINLAGYKNPFEWHDARKDANSVLREVVVNNTSQKNWVASVEYSDACREFLGSYYHEQYKKPLSKTLQLRTDEVEIKPGERIRADSCIGSKWRFSIAEKMCPPYQCLESCKC
jgi:hypothetical protein